MTLQQQWDNMTDVVALAVSDMHFSLKCPVARSAEPSWLKAQLRPLKQLSQLQREHQCPVLIAGDVFDKPHQPPELVNFLMRNWPQQVYAVPGQHDLPYHSYADIRKSSFWTMVEAGKITPIQPDRPIEIDQGKGPIRLHGFPWGFEIKPLEKPNDLLIDIAVIHQFVWTKATGFPNAPKDQRLHRLIPKLRGYDIAVFGDNHIPFCNRGDDKLRIINCGAFQRRKSDERQQQGYVGLIHKDNTIERVPLKTNKELWLDAKEIAEMVDLDIKGFMEELERLGDTGISFRETMNHFMDREQVSKTVRQVILAAMGEQ